MAAAHRKLFVQIQGTSFKGKVKLKSDNIYEPKQSLLCKIMKSDKSQHPPKFKLEIIDEKQVEAKDIINKSEEDAEAGEIYEVVNKMYQEEE